MFDASSSSLIRVNNSLVELTDQDIADIEEAGVVGARRLTVKTFVRRAAALTLFGAAVFGVCSYLGIDVL